MAAMDLVPLRVAPPGLFPSAIATAPLYPVARLPKRIERRTFTAGLMALSATVWLAGAERRCVAGPAVIAKMLLVVALSPVAGDRQPVSSCPSCRA